MEVYITNLDSRSTRDNVQEWLQPILEHMKIFVFDLRKRPGKTFANLTVTDAVKAQTLIRSAPSLLNVPRHPNTGKLASFSVSRNVPDPILIKVLRQEEKDWSAQGSLPKFGTKAQASRSRSGLAKQLEIVSFKCGSWTSKGGKMCFVPFFASRGQGFLTRRGRALVLKVGQEEQGNASETIFDYANMQSIVVSTMAGRQQLVIASTLAPQIYGSRSDQNALSMFSLLLGLSSTTAMDRFRKTTFPGCEQTIIGANLVYCIEPSKAVSRSQVESIVPTRVRVYSNQDCFMQEPSTNFVQQVKALNEAMRAQRFSFCIQFQLHALWANAILIPGEVHKLLPNIETTLRSGRSDYQTSAALRSLNLQLPPTGPETAMSEAGIVRATALLSQSSHVNSSGNDTRTDLVAIHRAFVTPTGIYLYGPDKETPNRVVRQFPGYEDCFLRVTFADEFGDKVQFDSEASNEEVLRGRFLSILQNGLTVVGERFDFLGFSHSSLRSQTCWFMRPFVNQGQLVTAYTVISSLGDFQHIHCPAKCAARIGQAFSDTERAIVVDPSHVTTISDIVRGPFTFTDGCGTISLSMLSKLHKNSPKRKQATLYQIRYKGAKGMLSLDSKLTGNQIKLRNSMVKFTGSPSNDLEICGANYNPLPFRLNRPMIKILEDLGIGYDVFDTLLQQAIESLRRSARSAQSAVDFLTSSLSENPIGLARVAQNLIDIGIDVVEDQFIREVVRALIEVQLRELKFRTRIPVAQAVTLYGISDETGHLEDGEVYVTFATATSEHACVSGRVAVTRSPALHPGDIQVVTAVDAPEGSALRSLTNCVVFSQKGARDLPSMLGGGDLDGDLFNIIFDGALIPSQSEAPADYPASQAVDIGREVTSKDITAFFVNFMESDQLGRIANLHQVYADLDSSGTRSVNCLKLASLHSAAVDFSKSGQPVNLREIPRTPPYRPDFMVPSASTKVHRGIKEAEEAAAVESNDSDRYHYYPSERVLGKLFRSINEDEFFEDLQDDQVSIFSREGLDNVVNAIWDIVLAKARSDGWNKYLDLAQQVKDYYNNKLLDIMSEYAMGNNKSLTEKEVLIGTIIGRPGAGSKRQREQSEMMKVRYKTELQDINQWMKTNTDDDPDEHLLLTIACLSLCVSTGQKQKQQQQTHDPRDDLRSFAWFAAGICVPKLIISKTTRPEPSAYFDW